jgi:hypothetical protein
MTDTVDRNAELRKQAAERISLVKKSKGKNKPLSPEQMREQSLANNKAIRRWAEEKKIGKSPSSFAST